MRKLAFLLSALLLNIFLQAQSFESLLTISESEAETFLKTQPKICDLKEGNWFNSSVYDPVRDMSGKLSILHFGDFRRPTDLRNILDLNAVQANFPGIRVVLMLSDTTALSEARILNFLTTYKIALPVFVPSEGYLASCTTIETAPVTIFLGPDGQKLLSHNGDLNDSLLRQSLPDLLNTFRKNLESNPLPFFGTFPENWQPIPLLKSARNLAVNTSDGYYFISDHASHRVLGISSLGDIVNCFGSGVEGLQDGADYSARFSGPAGMHFDGENRVLYVADQWNQSIRVIDLNSDSVSTLIGEIGKTQFPSLFYPSDVVLMNEELIIVGSGNPFLYRYNFSNGTLSPVIINSKPENFPYSIHSVTFDGFGNLIFSIPEIPAIGRLKDLEITYLIGGNEEALGRRDGRTEEAKLSYPTGLFFYEEEIYFSDTRNRALRKLSANQKKVETLFESDETDFLPGDLAIFNGQIATVNSMGETLMLMDLNSGSPRTTALLNFDCLLNEPVALTDLRDGSAIPLNMGVNQFEYKIELGDGYEIDPGGYSSVSLNTRSENVALANDEFEDGTLSLVILVNTEVDLKTDFTLEFDLFIRKVNNPSAQYRKLIAFFHETAPAETELIPFEIVTTYFPDRER